MDRDRAGQASEPKQLLSLDDLMHLSFVRQPTLSPDGTRVAYVLETFRAREDDRVQHLYVVATDGSSPPHQLTRGATHDGSPAWSPDSRYLAFLSTRPDELRVAQTKPDADGDKEHSPDRPQVWVLDLRAGGEPRQLTARAEGVAEFSWSPTGDRIAVAARDPSDADAAYLKGIRDAKHPKPLVVNRVQHKRDGLGYLDEVPTHIFIVDVATGEERRLTAGPASERRPRWSPDGSQLLFLSNRTGDADNNNRTDVWMVGADGSGARRITRGDVGAGGAEFSPDGNRVAFVTTAHPENSYEVERVVVVDVADATPVENLADHIGVGWLTVGGIVPDDIGGRDPVEAARVYPVPLDRTPLHVLTEGIPGPVMADLRWTDDSHLWAMAADHGQWRLMEVEDRGASGGAWRFLAPTDRDGSLMAFDVAGGVGVVALDRVDTATELWRVDRGGVAHRITRIHDDWLGSRLVSRPRWIRFPDPEPGSSDTVEGLVFFPPGLDEASAKNLPLLVSIHGGPMAFDAPTFGFDEQYWAARGYLVVQVNYHGSTSYGEAFCRSIQGDWGPREHQDVMAGVELAVSRGWADPERLYCTGFSQGGIMTNWAVGHTDRFRAAVSEHGMWDYVTAYGTDDCHLWWQDDLGVPWQNAGTYERIAPKSGLANIHTPLLIMAGQLDWRCPLDEAEQLYLSLKKRGIPTQLVIYQGEHHAITRPARWRDRLERIDGWLARYGGVALPADE